MFYLYLIGALVAGFIIYIVYLMLVPQKDHPNEGAFNRTLEKKGYKPDHIKFWNKYTNCIAVNDDNQKVSYGFVEDNMIRTKDFDYSDIVSFEVKEDGETVYKNSLKGAVIGGAIAGGVGAIIGSQTKKKGKTKIRTITLTVIVEDIKNPVINIPLFESTDGFDVNSGIINMAREYAQKWDGIFKVVLKKGQNASV